LLLKNSFLFCPLRKRDEQHSRADSVDGLTTDSDDIDNIITELQRSNLNNERRDEEINSDDEEDWESLQDQDSISIVVPSATEKSSHFQDLQGQGKDLES